MKKRSAFNKGPSKYGTYEGPRGSKEEWRSSFDEAWTSDSARAVIREETPWSLLGLEAGSSRDQIKSAFRKLMLVHHPDKGGNPETARKIMAAYYLLMEGAK